MPDFVTNRDFEAFFHASPGPGLSAVLVFDVGGSHVSAAVCTLPGYALRGLCHAPLPEEVAPHAVSRPDAAPVPQPNPAAKQFLSFLQSLGQRAIENSRLPFAALAGAALAMPGPFDYGNGISRMTHKLPSIFGFDLKSALAQRFGWPPSQVRFVNDAAAFLLGEVGAGAAKGAQRSIGITLGTGIGCAFAIDGQIATPANLPGGIPGVPPGGEIWNLPYNGATVEDFVSTRFLRHQYRALSGLEAEVSSIAETASGDHPCPDTASDILPNDPFAAHCRARQSFQDFGYHLGCVLNQHAKAFQPGIVVLGGGISRASHLFLPATRAALDLGFQTQIAISTLMDEAPLAGAAVHWFATQPAVAPLSPPPRSLP